MSDSIPRALLLVGLLTNSTPSLASGEEIKTLLIQEGNRPVIEAFGTTFFRGHCLIEVDLRLWLDETCTIGVDIEGVQVGIEGPAPELSASPYFAMLSRSNAESWRAVWNEGESHAHTHLGAVTQNGACFSSGRVYVCVGEAARIASEADAWARAPYIEPETSLAIDEALSGLTGWWGMTPDGCFDDRDNQYRMHIGRYRFDEDWQFIAGEGPASVGFYDGACYFLVRIALAFGFGCDKACLGNLALQSVDQGVHGDDCRDGLWILRCIENAERRPPGVADKDDVSARV